MTVEQIFVRQHLVVDIQEAWAFFSDPVNLATITPPWLDFQVTSKLPSLVYPGLIITYQIKPFLGLPVTWVTEITHAEAPTYFVDEQRFGPYRFWHHEHHFRAVGGGVEMVDRVSYALYFGKLSGLAHRYLIRPRLEEIFSFRRQKLAELFGELTPSDANSSVSGDT